MPEREYIIPDWPVPGHVRACVTTRQGGVSNGIYAGFNLADHVGDDPVAVSLNRQLLLADWHLPTPPRWLSQVHGCEVACLPDAISTEADACFTSHYDTPCAVLTADCLPLLLYNPAQQAVAAVHAGWRGLAAGVIEASVTRFAQTPAYQPLDMLVWLGPAISARHFEVGEEVLHAFVQHDATASRAFERVSETNWLADIYQLARQRLNALGIRQIFGGDFCTYAESRFYSYRRERDTGRMASLIWLQGDN